MHYNERSTNAVSLLLLIFDVDPSTLHCSQIRGSGVAECFIEFVEFKLQIEVQNKCHYLRCL